MYFASFPLNKVSSLAKVRFNKNVPQIKKIDSSLELFIYLLIGLIALLLYIIIYFSGNQDFASAIAWSVLFVSLMLGLLLLYPENIEPHINAKMWNFDTPLERRRGITKNSFILFMLLSPLVMAGVFIHLSEMTITQMGISVNNADIYMEKKVEPLFSGAREVNKDYLILRDVNILWTGVGSETVVEVEINNEPRKYVLKTNELSFRETLIKSP